MRMFPVGAARIAALSLVLSFASYAEETEPPSPESVRKSADQVYATAQMLHEQGNIKAALGGFLIAAAGYQRAGAVGDEGKAWFQLGAILRNQNNCQEVVKAMRQAVPRLKAVRHELEGVATFLLGECLGNHLGQPQEAIELLQRASTLLKEPHDSLYQAMALMALGSLRNEQGQSREAIEDLKRASLLFASLKQPLSVASVTTTIASIHERASENMQAREQYLKALPLYRAAGHRLMEAHVTHSLGMIAGSQGLILEELGHYQRALQIYEELGISGAQASVEHSLGLLYRRMGNPPLALQYLERAEASWSAVGRLPKEQLPLPDDYESLSPVLSKAFRHQLTDRSPGGQALTLYHRGQLHMRLEQWSQAVECLERALALARSSKDREVEATSLTDLAQAYAGTKQPQRAQAAFDRALKIAQQLKQPFWEANALLEIARFQATRGQSRKAARTLKRLDGPLARISQPLHQAIVLSHMSITYKRLEDPAGTLRSSQRALALFQQHGADEYAADRLSDIGFAYELQGQPAKALTSYEQAISMGDRARAAAGLDEMKTWVASQLFMKAYQRAILLNLRAGRAEKAFELSESGRARSFLDGLGSARVELATEPGNALVDEHRVLARKLAGLDARIAEVRSMPMASAKSRALLTSLLSERVDLRRQADDLLLRLKATAPRYASLQSVDPLQLSEVQQFLDTRTTLVSYMVTEEQVVAFVINQGSFHSVILPITEERLRYLITEAFGPTGFAALSELPTGILQELHGALITPIAPYLKTPRVGIIPHGVLHYLPFAALTDGQRYLGDTHTLFHLPSASVLRYLPKKPAEAGRVLAMSQGQPVGFPMLRFANPEAHSIAQTYGTQALTGAAATEAAFKAGSRGASILHVAAHGELDPLSPLFSRIVLAPGAEEDGSLTVGEIYGLDLSAARLVVLSACQTNLGAHSHGDEVVGLTRAFLYAQAPTIVSSLWTVHDEAAQVLMTEFHAQLGQGKSKAEALREAQVRTRARFAHPYYWAAFVLTGLPD